MSAMKGNGRGPSIQEKMLKVLSDGMPHSKQELFACLYEQDAPINNIANHITALRKRLRPHGQDVVIEFIKRRVYYKHVRLLVSPYDGKR